MGVEYIKSEFTQNVIQSKRILRKTFMRKAAILYL